MSCFANGVAPVAADITHFAGWVLLVIYNLSLNDSESVFWSFGQLYNTALNFNVLE